MEAMRQSWTDDRLDDLRNDLNEFRAETKVEFAAVREEMRENSPRCGRRCTMDSPRCGRI